jgi:restriction system protein
MSIPDFQTLMLPLLRKTADGQEHDIRDVTKTLADEFHLTPEERSQLLPSGRQPVFNNRAHWARTHLVKAGVLEAPRRAFIKITARGQHILTSPPTRLDMAFLAQYPEYQEFREATTEPAAPAVPEPSAAKTPEEAMESAYQVTRDALALELLEHLKAARPSFFESVVVRLLVAMGYGGSIEDAASVVGQSGDQGIDGIIKEDKLGLDVIYVQAKKWDNSVGRPHIQQFAGALHGQRARKGVFITTSTFTKDARDYVAHIDPRIVLIDGKELASLMIDFNVGVTSQRSYELKRVDSDFFVDE